MNIKKCIPVCIGLIIFGCAPMLTSTQDPYSKEYKRLIEIKPRCQSPALKFYSACLAASDLLESSSPEEATLKFIAHWKETAFGMAARREQIDEMHHSPHDAALESGEWGSVKRAEIETTQEIVLPVLRQYYTNLKDNYSSQMVKQLDLVILDSKSSFDSFRGYHSRLSRAE
jgi:hypothetical protein